MAGLCSGSSAALAGRLACKLRVHMPAKATPDTTTNHQQEREYVLATLRAEADAVARVAELLGPELHEAIDLMARSVEVGGTVFVAGIGKSGLIGKKIAATLASLGAPSHDIHPVDAMHGDLGRIRRVDCVLALSYSGETEEVVALASVLRQDGVPVVALTGGAKDKPNALAKLASVHLTVGAVEEACPLTMAPTSSTTATLALGDALALAVSRRLSQRAEDFHKRHPGGGLGGLLRPVTDILRFVVGRNLPVVPDTLSVDDALRRSSELGRRPGAMILVDDAGVMTGLFTDGDLRRLVLASVGDVEAAMQRPIADVMTRSPRTLTGDALVRDAARLFREHRQDEIPVVDAQGKPLGVLDVQDLIAMRIVRD